MTEQTWKVVYVGQNPGDPRRYEQKREDWPVFKKLDQWFQRVGLPARTAHLQPLINVYPDHIGPDAPNPAQVNFGRSLLVNQLRELQPEIVITLGRIACDALLAGHHDFYRDAGNSYPSNAFDMPFTIVPLPHPSGRNRMENTTEGREAVDKAMRTVKKLVMGERAYEWHVPWEPKFSDDWVRPPELEGNEFFIRESMVRGRYDVILDGKPIGDIWTGRTSPFKPPEKGELRGWFCSDSQGGEYYVEPMNAAAAVAFRHVTGQPPPGQTDLRRKWAWEDRCGRELTATQWLEVRGPYTPEHPFTEPVGNWPPCQEIGRAKQPRVLAPIRVAERYSKNLLFGEDE